LLQVQVSFDLAGSYSQTFREQYADLAFCTGLLGRKLTDSCFSSSLEDIRQYMKVEFKIEPLDNADHPNFLVLKIPSRLRKQLRRFMQLVK